MATNGNGTTAFRLQPLAAVGRPVDIGFGPRILRAKETQAGGLPSQSIHARWVAIVDAKEGEPAVLEDHVVTFSEGRISSIVPRSSFTGKVDVKLDTHVLIPGFVNCHAHS